MKVQNHFAGNRIESDDVVRRLHRIENTIDDQWRRLEPADGLRWPEPGEIEVANILRCEVGQAAVTSTQDGSGVGEPVLRFPVGVQDPVKRHGRERQTRRPKPFREAVQTRRPAESGTRFTVICDGLSPVS